AGEPDDGRAYGDQGAQYDGYGPNGHDGHDAYDGHDGYQGNGHGGRGQRSYDQHGQYAGPGGYGQQQPQPRQDGYGRPGYDQQGYRRPGYGPPGPPGYQPGQGYDQQPTQTVSYRGGGGNRPGNGDPRGYGGYDEGYAGDRGGYADARSRGNMRQYEDPRRLEDDDYQASGQGPGDPANPGGASQDGRRPGKVRFRRTRRLYRRRSVRIVSAVLGVFLVWVMFSLGQASFKNNGQGVSANAAEWFRDHGMGPAVTFGEWLSYSPPKSGGQPSISYAVPSNEAVTPVKAAKGKKGFVPDIPATLKPLAAGPALQGEGQWRVVERVHGYPAILTTLLRDGGQYTSYSNGIASIDQRLVKFSLRPGTEDPGTTQNWGAPAYIPKGQYKGLLATFNGVFKLDSAGGGFYLNGIYHGKLVSGAASVVYYKSGAIKIGAWGRDFTMNSSIAGVRQNLKLLVDHGKTASNANQNVQSNWGATLGGGEWVWRSGLGITKDGRIVYVYGQKLDAQDLALLLQRAGAVEGMQLDINPAWMKFDLYTTHGNTAQPSAVPLLSAQQPSVYSYLTPSTRDFTAVYTR
ncbi:MAG: hypothetical protein ACRDNS_31465, partial [Trebonia sp.]